MILVNIFFTVIFGIAGLYTFYLAIKIMLMPNSEYDNIRKQLHDSWVTTEDGNLMIKRGGVGIKRKLSRKTNLKQNQLID